MENNEKLSINKNPKTIHPRSFYNVTKPDDYKSRKISSQTSTVKTTATLSPPRAHSSLLPCTNYQPYYRHHNHHNHQTNHPYYVYQYYCCDNIDYYNNQTYQNISSSTSAIVPSVYISSFVDNDNDNRSIAINRQEIDANIFNNNNNDLTDNQIMIMPLECMYSVPPSPTTLIPPPPLFRNDENNSIIDHQHGIPESIMENNRMVENSFNLNQIKTLASPSPSPTTITTMHLPQSASTTSLRY